MCCKLITLKQQTTHKELHTKKKITFLCMFRGDLCSKVRGSSFFFLYRHRRAHTDIKANLGTQLLSVSRGFENYAQSFARWLFNYMRIWQKVYLRGNFLTYFRPQTKKLLYGLVFRLFQRLNRKLNWNRNKNQILPWE